MKKRKVYLDVLRAIACCMVVAFMYLLSKSLCWAHRVSVLNL